MNVSLIRTQFGALHDEFRNQGLNPIEAVAQIAVLLDGTDGLSSSRLELSAQARAALESLSEDRYRLSGATAIGFQEFLTSDARNGLGQYLTPLPVAELMADVVSTLKPSGVAVDPFCGSGLLLDTLSKRALDLRMIGVEINPTVARLAEFMGQLTATPLDIWRGDAFSMWIDDELPTADVVVANPPFGSKLAEPDREALRLRGVPESITSMKSIPTELLGLEVAVQILRPGGSLAIVLPQSVLTNNSWAGYRSDLFSRIVAHSVVSLPEPTFAPFRGVAKACVLFAKKAPGRLPASIPFVRSLSVGYDETGRPSGSSDLGDVASRLRGSSPLPLALVSEEGSISLPPTFALRPEVCHRLGDVAEVFTGQNPPRSEFADEGPWILKVGNLGGSFVAWKSRARNHVSDPFYEKKSRYHVRVGDLCLTAAAHRPRYIGLKVDLIDVLPSEGVMASSETLVVRLHKTAPFRPEHLLLYLRSASGYAQIQDLVRGSTAHLYARDMENLLIPPLESLDSLDEVSNLHENAADSFRSYLAAEAAARETMNRQLQALLARSTVDEPPVDR